MSAKLMVTALDPGGRIYALRDEEGNTVGTGTRDVCEVLLFLASKPLSPSGSDRARLQLPRTNVKSAISV